MKILVPNLKFNNPINEEKLDEMLSLLEVDSDDLIVDIGGGNGSVLLKMIEESKAKGILIELNEKLLEVCRAKSSSLIDSGKLILVASDAKTYLQELDESSVDCFVCIGSSYALGGYSELIKLTTPYLKSGGFILIGEEYWNKKPSEEYLKILEGSESDSKYHYQNIEVAEELGLTYLYSHVASEEDWNRFEGKYFLEEELKAGTLTDSEREEHLKQLRNFRNGQFKFGRSTMGFGLYLFMK